MVKKTIGKQLVIVLAGMILVVNACMAMAADKLASGSSPTVSAATLANSGASMQQNPAIAALQSELSKANQDGDNSRLLISFLRDIAQSYQKTITADQAMITSLRKTIADMKVKTPASLPAAPTPSSHPK